MGTKSSKFKLFRKSSKIKRVRQQEAAEKKMEKNMRESLGRILNFEFKLEKMAIAVSSMRNILGLVHTLIVSLKYETHTAEYVVSKLRSVVNARDMGMVVDRLRRVIK
ncbi:hypothetical protein EVAR_41150_1 [Eumeta japonica]|uniref:Uncharacterized protein n=1 Tax=Eumeta variegata TaxID=151549 RepID=A0A4C1YD82_EUMVA|nr:hypothetical protein EVAR_41150_1 [Eumeta japonica]